MAMPEIAERQNASELSSRALHDRSSRPTDIALQSRQKLAFMHELE